MATLTIRNLPDDVHDALRRRAAEHRRSMEAEAREVLSQGVRTRPSRAEAQRIVESYWTERPPPRPDEPPGWSVVDEFLAEKRLEGAWENGEVTDEERRAWLDRLGRFEVQPGELEAFLVTRRRRA